MARVATRQMRLIAIGRRNWLGGAAVPEGRRDGTPEGRRDGTRSPKGEVTAPVHRRAR